MEPEGSLPYSPVSTICLYPEPARSSPHPPHPIYLRSILILFFHLCLGLPSGLFRLGFPNIEVLIIVYIIRNLNGKKTKRETYKNLIT
jgi:hypothetical protein